MHTIEKLSGVAFLAFPEMKNLLTSELASRFGYGKVVDAATIGGKSFLHDGKAVWYGDLLYCPDFSVELSENENPALPYWARSCMISPFLVHFDSIADAANALKEMQRNWAPYQYQLFRRASLIQEKLPYINLKTRTFPVKIPNSPMGMYTLLDEKTMLASALTNSTLPAGTIQFVEDHENPPSRAYLKIQESLTLYNSYFGVELPKEGDKCFEAGACPGGWTWVLRLLGADVLAVDRAELAPSLMADEHVKFMAHDAFTLKPDEVCKILNCEKLDWLLSDVICYPERLFEWIGMWRESGRAKNIICTIKMQGAIDWPLIDEFAKIQNSKIVHLNYNKHELTIMIKN
ncbi:SAM-dependent methyltransferase [uncultured Treponema sp.]|uniref:SAM-dependent methyltransferase n=1 Tax=uncultured Treponema sp. TaxID=162155 RepID=UPI0025DDB0B0|nr:SAM-dependent methyltransferase [uncultured Treponema sp.]